MRLSLFHTTPQVQSFRLSRIMRQTVSLILRLLFMAVLRRDILVVLLPSFRTSTDRTAMNTPVPGSRQLTKERMRDATIGDGCQPPSFDAMKKPDFADWNFNLKAFVGNLKRRALTWMNEVERAQDPLPCDRCDDEGRQLTQSRKTYSTESAQGRDQGRQRQRKGMDYQKQELNGQGRVKQRQQGHEQWQGQE